MNRYLSKNHSPDRRPKPDGFSLVEVVIAIAIVGLTFLAILGTLSVGVTSDQASSQQTVATNIASSIVADLRSTPANVPSGIGTYALPAGSTRFQIPLPGIKAIPPALLANLAPPVLSILYFDNSSNFISLNPATVPVNAVYAARVYPALVSYVGAGPSDHPLDGYARFTSQYAYMVRINVAWPAQAPTPAAAALPAYVGSVDVVTQFITH